MGKGFAVPGLVCATCLVILLLVGLPLSANGAPVSGAVDGDLTVVSGGSGSAVEESEFIDDFAEEDDWLDDDEFAEINVFDPLEPVNRAFFLFNDKLYFWLLRPVAKGYGFVVPKPARKCVRNFFHNLTMPVRFVNNLLQGKISRSGTELARFAVNSTVGVAGLWDPARNWLEITPSEEDLGQTLGKYGLGEGFYICWPILGPSNVRDSLGLVGDYFLDPASYLAINNEKEAALALAIWGGEKVNTISLRIGDYEDFKAASFDPYSALRDAYFQQRRSKIRDE
jgi:phospholipid-binding lipoprotein MlaA